jgi:putative two-component system hydrogenase maturation factor HypX/HoxX
MEMAQTLSQSLTYQGLLKEKFKGLKRDQQLKPLEQYESEELEKVHKNFFGFDPSYHIARHNFIYNIPKSRTPRHLALHRNLNYKES